MLAPCPKPLNVSRSFDLLGFLSFLRTLKVLPASVEKMFSAPFISSTKPEQCVYVLYMITILQQKTSKCVILVLF